MFFSKVVLFAISLGAVLVHATPHALNNHHALHRRVAARVASTPSNSSAVSVKRQNSAKCSHRSIPPSSSAPSSTIPAVTAIVSTPQSKPSPLTSSAPSSTPPPPPPPSTTSTPQPPPPSTTSTPAPSPSSGANGPFSGDGTFFATGLGACGITNVATDFIIAISEIRFDAASTGPNPNDNPLCGKKVTISYQGNTATATITDRCVGCADDSIDMTTSLFLVFAQLSIGRIFDVKWSFID